jgi:flagellar biosynthesis protein FlhG
VFDQAEMLRNRMQFPQETPPEAKVISVVSGKGGVGKTNIALNFALALQKLGKKVILFDLDIGMANLDILMGITARKTIVDMIEQDLPIRDIVETGSHGLAFIAGGTGLTTLFRLDEDNLSWFLAQLQSIHSNYDFIIFDMGAGISTDSTKFILSADEIILVTTPEPTAITDAYSVLKFIHYKEKQLPLHLLVNRCDSEKEGQEITARFQAVAEHFLQKKISLLGMLPDDRTVLQAVKSQVPFLDFAPKSKVSRSLKEVAKNYAGIENDRHRSFGSFLNKLKNHLTETRSK